MEKFNTSVDVQIDYDSVKPMGFNYETRNSNTKIEYHFILELRSWGIKSFSFILPAQEVQFDLDLIKDNEDDYENYSFKIKIDGDTELPENISQGDICPKELSIEIKELRQTGPYSFEGLGKAVLSFED